ncbi:hypothetical protein AUEXF2481DRAFT_94 [Aureobasidium subglaciale EXF-2481]|uniref:Uncharacterized protein n=1 Tax=Aureobasidium subglaciale (strain EXF-2481) TaxID=1043005 RepID=A0A074ZPB1_AURSE|nr:uncharacterized protein AUEXF2481DRAFT_94 [Aureobasidium subglaciale EXF-2481]KER00132.1 hypothetical protein AUEXF2481DRAFT_94 [Aureobasidium subglaciale EXF-2481]
MADPISTTDLVSTVAQIISTLHAYATAISQAREDITALSTELLVLQGVLKQAEKRVPGNNSGSSTYADHDPRRVVEFTARSLEILRCKLDETGLTPFTLLSSDRVSGGEAQRVIKDMKLPAKIIGGEKWGGTREDKDPPQCSGVENTESHDTQVVSG